MGQGDIQRSDQFAREVLQQQSDCLATDLACRLAYGGQGRRRVPRKADVVEPHDGHVLRAGQPPQPNGMERAESHLITEAEDRTRPCSHQVLSFSEARFDGEIPMADPERGRRRQG